MSEEKKVPKGAEQQVCRECGALGNWHIGTLEYDAERAVELYYCRSCRHRWREEV